MKQYALGVDFGTSSGRVILLEVHTGVEVGSVEVPYPHGVIDQTLPGTGEPLPIDWALQHPADWLKVLLDGIPRIVSETGVDPRAIVGIGVDFTSCTVLPAQSDGTPLCLTERWRHSKHAWPKLWKHHAAQQVANRLTDVAHERSEAFVDRFGGRISSEWYFPKLIEIWLEDRALYDDMAAFLEATDWIVWWLTGHETRQLCTAGYKAMWSPDDGLPSREYFEAAFPGFSDPSAKIGNAFVPLGTKAGTLRSELAGTLGLPDSVSVAVGNVDSFVSVPGAGVEAPGVFVTVIGTSTCSMLVDTKEVLLPGITGCVRDGILPGRFGYEAGQAAVGDMLAWMVEKLSPNWTYTELENRAAGFEPGETGLLALDWWNGNRTILADADLTGAIVGLNLTTTPEHIYRALLESIAFGSRRIIDNFEDYGLEVRKIVACGGLAHRSPLLMQLLADTSGRSVHVPASTEIPARGSALFGAVAAGVFASIDDAIAATRPESADIYLPRADSVATYDQLYGIYRELYDLLGRRESDLMHRLKRLRTRSSAAAEASR